MLLAEILLHNSDAIHDKYNYINIYVLFTSYTCTKIKNATKITTPIVETVSL